MPHNQKRTGESGTKSTMPFPPLGLTEICLHEKDSGGEEPFRVLSVSWWQGEQEFEMLLTCTSVALVMEYLEERGWELVEYDGRGSFLRDPRVQEMIRMSGLDPESYVAKYPQASPASPR